MERLDSRRASAIVLGVAGFIVQTIQLWIVDPDDRALRTVVGLMAIVLAGWAGQRWRSR